MGKLRVGVLFGGRSGEHEVSLLSAASVIDALDPCKYEIVPIGITKEGRWLSGAGATKLLPAAVLEHGKPALMSPEPMTIDRRNDGSRLQVDVVVPILHGTFGEDGTIQGLFELAGVPYVGAGVLGSAAGMDKVIMKRLFREAGLPIVDYVPVRRSEWEAEPAAVASRIVKQLRYPMFVKPANLGSSVGISKVHNRKELGPALDEAARFDAKIIVEQGVDARELECAVLGNEQPRASLPGEIIAGREFYDYSAKYLEEGSQIIIPARLTAAQTRRVQELAVRAFEAVDCAGLARVDFFLVRKTGRLLVNEINTMPGFTAISMFPKMWAASGLLYPQLLDRMIELALERARDRQRNRYSR